MKYIELQANKEEEILSLGGESNLKLPLNTDNIDRASIINNEAGKLNVELTIQEATDSDGVRIVSDEGLSDQNSNINPQSPSLAATSKMQTKYVNQLTLEMIESEGVVKLKEKGKPNTANGIARPKFKNSLR